MATRKLMQITNAAMSIDSLLQKCNDAELLQARCEGLFNFFKDQQPTLVEATQRVEQLKGIHKGIQLSVPIVAQFFEIIKEQFKDEKKEAIKAKLDVVQSCVTALNEALKKQSQDLSREIGMFDQSVTNQLGLLKKIESSINHHEEMKKNPVMETKDEIDQILEKQAQIAQKKKINGKSSTSKNNKEVSQATS